jgi:NTE family protein
MPGLFAPVEVDGRMLVDGGLSNNLPVSILHDHQTRFTIGVRLFWQSVSWNRPADSEEEDRKTESESWSELTALGERLASWFIENMPHGFADVQRSLDLVVKEHENLRLKMHPPDLLITPEVTGIGMLEFHENEDLLLERGVQAAHSHADTLEQLANRKVQAHDSLLVAEKDAKEFHRVVCTCADQIETRITFDSIEEAKEAGYRPCEDCKPADRPITERPE